MLKKILTVFKIQIGISIESIVPFSKLFLFPCLSYQDLHTTLKHKALKIQSGITHEPIVLFSKVLHFCVSY